MPGDTTRRTPRDTAGSVPIPPRPDSIRVDSSGSVVPFPAKAARDSAAKADTLRRPSARSETPVLLEAGESFRWDRAAMFASGAITLTDLLERVPGLVPFRAGWITGPEVGSYLGDAGAVRVFYDGLELSVLDPRGGGVGDLSTIELWTLEEVAIERGAGELRVYLRSLRTDKTIPQTRIDVSTGDEDTNLYRGFYGKRFGGGQILQAGFQQFSAKNARVGGNGDEVSVMARTGIARGRWSVDLFALRSSRSRADRKNALEGGSLLLPAEDARRTVGYVRAGYGDPERGGWIQLTAGAHEFGETSPRRAASTTGGFPADSADTTRYEGQYVAAAGVTRGVLRLSATGRMRTFEGHSFTGGSARASIDQRFVGLSLFAERDPVDSTSRADAVVRLAPLRFLRFTGAATVVRPDDATERPKSITVRGEGAVRLWGLWVGGGVIARDTAVLRPPTPLNPDFAPIVLPRTTGVFASARGRFLTAFYADAYGIQWDRDAYYTPRQESHSELGVSGRWLERFPSGNFGFKLAGIFDYRSGTYFPVTSSDGSELTPSFVASSKVLGALLEIRIVNATLSYQLRNALGYQYEQVPGYEMPRTVNFYGVRWDFQN